MQCGEAGLALSYLRTHGWNMNSLEEFKLKIGVSVGNSQVAAAYHITVSDLQTIFESLSYECSISILKHAFSSS